VPPLFAFIFFYAFSNLSFLQEKVLHQFEQALQMSNFDISNTRFGALNMDLQYIRSSPIFGNGVHVLTRYRFHPWVSDDIGHGNGMSNFISFWGIPFFLFWFFGLFHYFQKKLSSFFYALSFSFAVLLILQSEQFLNYPLFMIFFFVGSYPLLQLKYESTLDFK
jgi:hypothetical protein